MSADLFAEFSTDSNTNQKRANTTTQPASSFSFFDDLSSQAPSAPPQPTAFSQNFGTDHTFPAQTLEDDTDDWGDFEGGSSSANPGPPAQHDPFAFVSNQSQPPQQTWTSQPLAHDLFSAQPAYPPQVSHESWTKAPIIKAKKPTDSSVLFDAEDLEDDDDFGDFEDSQSKIVTPAPSVPVESSSALVDLLGDLDVSQPKPSVTSTKSKARSKPKTARPTPVQGKKQASAPKSQVVDDSWDTFDDWEASIPAEASKKPKATESITPTSSAPAPILSPAIGEISPGELPPTNVPPPGVLLSLFPSFFADAQEKLFKPMAAQTLPMRNKLLAEPGTIAYLQGYLTLASVAAHVIAGRKLRWKRDQHLSQGMRIGPASSRATSGMKLTGIDRGENLKEEREASDVVRVWKDQIGRLRHVVSGVNQIKAGTLGAAPDLQETMPVRTLKQSEGGVPARQACMLCGLKRDERVGAADMMVEDSFGEWWIEQVNMHRGASPLQTRRSPRLTLFTGCRNFWNEHKDKLRQR
ncbi:hypothetical protein N0V95_001640 [Ascochyta clinopodiicola]|nr:hypothetical protein N0V95_001640 [Ascochyta clinopodiicola]